MNVCEQNWRNQKIAPWIPGVQGINSPLRVSPMTPKEKPGLPPASRSINSGNVQQARLEFCTGKCFLLKWNGSGFGSPVQFVAAGNARRFGANSCLVMARIRPSRRGNLLCVHQRFLSQYRSFDQFGMAVELRDFPGRSFKHYHCVARGLLGRIQHLRIGADFEITG
jgi:hypothetical protein